LSREVPDEPRRRRWQEALARAVDTIAGLTAVDGELTLHGVTRGVTFKVTRLQCGASPVDGREGCGAEASGTVHRSEFGMGFAASLIGDDVELRFLVTAFRVPDTGETDTY